MKSQRVKVIRLIARLNVGGPAKHVTWLTAHLDPARYNSLLVTGRVEENEIEMDYFVRASGVKPFYLDNLRRSIGSSDLLGFWEIFNLLIREKPDILHTHASKAGFLGRLAALIINLGRRLMFQRPIRIVHTFHGHTFHGYHSPLMNRIILFIERVLARLSTDTIIVISPLQQDEIFKTYRIGRPHQFRLIPLGLDLEPYHNINQQKGRFKNLFGLSPETMIIGIVGRLTSIKNHRRFLAICAHLNQHYGELLMHQQVRFAIIGDGELRNGLEDEAQQLGLRALVLFSGNIENQLDYLPDLDILALTSDNEGTPLTIIEAMACGIPVIATAVGGVPDLLADGQRGFLIDKDDVEEYARQLAQLLSQPEVRADFGGRGKEFVSHAHSLQRLLNDIDELYCNLTGTSKAETA